VSVGSLSTGSRGSGDFARYRREAFDLS